MDLGLKIAGVTKKGQ